MDDNEDPEALARAFLGGRNLKRSTLMEVVGALLQRLEHGPGPAEPCNTPSIPRGVPSADGYDGRPPIKVQNGTAGSVYLGPESNRYYTRQEAIALAGAIARAATQGR